MPLKAVFVGNEATYDFMRQSLRPDWDWQLPVPTINDFWDYADQGAIDENTAIVIVSPEFYDPGSLEYSEDFFNLVYYSTQTALTMVISYDPEEKNQIISDLVGFAGQAQAQTGDALKPYWWIDANTPLPDIDAAIKGYINDELSDPETAQLIANAEGLQILRNGDENSIMQQASNIIDSFKNNTPQSSDVYTNNYGKRGVTITVTSSKGGAGKTTVSLGLAEWIAKSSKLAVERGTLPKDLKVCVVDLDVHDSQIGAVIGQIRPTILELAMNPTKDQSTMQDSLIYADRLNCWVLLSPKLPKTSDTIPISTFEEAIRILQQMFDVVIMDTSVDYSDELFTRIVYPISDYIIFVTTLDRRSIVGMAKWIMHVGQPESMGGAGIDLGKVGVLINRGQKNVNMTTNEIRSLIQGATRSVYFNIDKSIPPEQWHQPQIISAIRNIEQGLLTSVANRQRFDLALQIAPFEDGIHRAVKHVLPNFYNKLPSLSE